MDSEKGNRTLENASFLLDTNVWLDYFIGDRPGNRTVMNLLHKAEASEVELCFAVHCSKDVFYLIESSLKYEVRISNGGNLSEGSALAARSAAWGCIQNMFELATAIGCDESDVWIASKQRNVHSDYEDDLLIAAAMRADAILITNDRNLIVHSPVAALTVEDALTYLGQ